MGAELKYIAALILCSSSALLKSERHFEQSMLRLCMKFPKHLNFHVNSGNSTQIPPQIQISQFPPLCYEVFNIF